DRELKQTIESRPDLNDPLVRTVLANLDAEQAYSPVGRYPGVITYFEARDALSDFEDNRAGWKNLAAGVNVHVAPGDHSTIREEPNISELVAILKPALSDESAND